MGRKILAVILGMLAGGLTVALLESISTLLYPMPDDLDPADAEALREFVATLPPPAFMIVLAAHAVGAFVGGLLCVVIARAPWKLGAAIVGTLFFVAGAANIVALPHPLWFSIADLLIYLPAAFAGAQVAIELGWVERRLDPQPQAEPLQQP